MELIDDLIQDDIKNTYNAKKIPWMKPIVRMHSNLIPFIPPDITDLIHDPNILETPVGKLFCEPGCEMEIDFPEEIIPQSPQQKNNPTLLKTATLQSISQIYSHNSIPRIKEINKTFGFNSTSSFFGNISAPSPQTAVGNVKMFSFRVATFQSMFKMVEPMICSAFLFDDREKVIVSDYWNFIPQCSTSFFDKENIQYGNNLVASFQADPKFVQEESYLIILLSHPLGEDNSAAMIKYFQNPISATEQSAEKKMKQIFPRMKDVFTTFACTYIKFSALRNAGDKPVQLPPPFITEAPLPEDKIHDLISDASKKNLKQIQIQIELQRIQEQFLTIRPISKLRAQPLLFPIHQLSIRINSVKISSSLKFKNIIVGVSLRSGSNIIKGIHTKLDPFNTAEVDYTRCFYHNRSPPFDDSFLFDLPYPIPDDLELVFELFHVHVKPSEKQMTPIGTARQSVFNPLNKDILIKDLQNVTLSIESANSSDKGKDKISISTYLRSNLSTNSQSFYDFVEYHKIDLVARILAMPKNIIITNLMYILEIILSTELEADTFSFHAFTTLRDQCLPRLDPLMFERFLMIYVRYFAFRSKEPIKVKVEDQPIKLSEQNKNRQSPMETSSLLILPKSDPVCDKSLEVSQADANVTDSLIDFNFQKPSSPQQNNSSNEDNEIRSFLTKFFTEYSKVLNSDEGLTSLQSLVDFFFTLIIKALTVTKITILGSEFDEFLKNYCQKISPDPNISRKHVKSLGLFSNLLFDIGMPSMSSKVTFIVISTFLEKPQMHWIIITYINFAFRPSLFYYSLKYVSEFKEILITLLRKAMKSINSEGLRPIFAILLQLFGSYDIDMTTEIASILIECLKGLRPNQLPPTTEIITHLAFFNFLLEFSDKKALQNFTKTENSPTLFKLVHFMIGHVTLKEMTIVRRFQICKTTSNEEPQKEVKPLNSGPVHRQRSDTVKPKKRPVIVPQPATNRPQDNFVSNDPLPTIDSSKPIVLPKPKYPPRPQSPPKQTTTPPQSINPFNTLDSKDPTAAAVSPEKPQFNTDKATFTPSQRKVPRPHRSARKSSLTPTAYEMINTTHSALIHFAQTYIQVADTHVAVGILGFVYHMLETDMNPQYYPLLFKLLSDLLSNFSPVILEVTSPCWIRVFERLFKLAPTINDVSILVSPVETLLDVDLKVNKCQYASMAILIRAMSFLKKDDLMNENVCKLFEVFMKSNDKNQKDLANIYITLKEQAKLLLNKTSSSEERCDALLKRFFSLKGSPDAQFHTLSKIYKIHNEFNNYEEMINISFLQAAIIIEYLVATMKMKNYFAIEHPAMVFIHNCSFASYAVTPREVLPKVPGFADSEFFSELGFISLLNRILQISTKGSIFESAFSVVDILWPILEQLRHYESIENMFNIYQEIFTKEAQENSHNPDALTYRYFRVTFFGASFGNDDRKSYIYRENKLVGLFDFTDSVKKKYEELFHKEVQIISDSGKVDESTLKNDIDYIQVTFVKPLIKKIKDKSEQDNTTIGLSLIHKEFFFESPFIYGSNEKQGPIDKQWIRHTVLTTEFYLPNICKRSSIVSEVSTDFEPIRVVYRQLRERTNDINDAYEARDINKIQQMLSGSLVVTVNEGPAKIVEVFLSGPPDDNDKRKFKLKQEFCRFLEILQKAVSFHAEHVTKNPEFMQLQIQMEEGFQKLKHILEPHIVNVNINN
ncbi:hypothetical protein M9Y10_002644 [Tritrichomonas musculus]|uniref:DOCKER domain-containing protein n=1 Tax=Tritrichomonas musculus TaxID=1915356 RepID=A0ABR2LBF9_9EUKA